MNLIFIMADSLRRDHLGCYGNKWIETPNLDLLAQDSLIFNRAYVASHPTIPNRTDIFTGRYTFPFRDWAPLRSEDVILSEVIGEEGYTSMLIADNPHMMNNEYNFNRGFSGWWWIRGQENDRYITDPTIPIKFPCAPHKLREPERIVKKFMRNTASRKYEKDYFAPQVMTKAMEWLERNYKLDRFLLWVDSFDPHEPWDPPYPYNRMYNPGYEGEEIIYPEYGKCDYMTEAELKQVRALYAGEITMLDKWVGYLLDKIEQLGLFENTAIIFTSDHGHYHGDHGAIGKPWAALGEDMGSLYEEMTRVPLLIRLPNRERGKRIEALVQSTDMMPTILDLLGVPAEGTIQGKSLMPLIEGKVERLHSCTFSARYQECISVVNEEGWDLICWPKSLWPRRAELYNLNDDPKQEKDLIDEREDIAESLRQRLLAFLREVGLEEDKVIDYKL